MANRSSELSLGAVESEVVMNEYPRKENGVIAWISRHAEEIIFVGGILVAYKLGTINGYTWCYKDLTKSIRR